MVYFIHYKQGLWYQSVTPRKSKAETFPGLTPRWVSNPMYIVSKVKQTLHNILRVLQFISKDTVYTVVIHSIYIDKRNGSSCTSSSDQKKSPGTCSNVDLRTQAVWKSA